MNVCGKSAGLFVLILVYVRSFNSHLFIVQTKYANIIQPAYRFCSSFIELIFVRNDEIILCKINAKCKLCSVYLASVVYLLFG